MKSTEMQFENTNYLEDIEDLVNSVGEMEYYSHSSAKLRIQQWLASAYVTGCVAAGVWLEKQSRRVNKEVEDNPFAEFNERQADAIDETLREPEERYDEALPKAQYFFHQLSEKQRPLLGELGQRFQTGGSVDDAYYIAQEKIHGLNREQAEEKRQRKAEAMNTPFVDTVIKTLRAVEAPPKMQPFFTKDDFYRFLEKFDRYLNNLQCFYLGGTSNKGKEVEAADPRETRDPAAWAADVTLLHDLRQRVVNLMESHDTSHDEVPEDETGAHQGTLPASH